LIKKSASLKGYTACKLLKEFPSKRWSKRGLHRLLEKVRNTDTVDRLPGSGIDKAVESVAAYARVEAKGRHFEHLL